MGSFKIIYKQVGKYSAVIYSVSYQNPIEDIGMISSELKRHLPAGCYVLFDLLLSNGDNFNRFAEAYYDGSDLSIDSISIADVAPGQLKGLNLYYRGKTKELSKSVLSSKERFRFAMMK